MDIRTVWMAAVVFGSLGLGTAAEADSGGHVYSMSNGAGGNVVSVLRNKGDGTLRLLGQYATGGNGTGTGITIPPDPLGSQDSIVLSPDKRWLFAASAASNQISTFRVLGDALALTSVVASGGSYPVSIAIRGSRVYVLNGAGQPNVTGFYLSPGGGLFPIPDSTRTVTAPTVSAGVQPNVMDNPAQLGFSPDGRWLIVTDKNVSDPGTLSVFPVGADGRLGASAVVTVSPDAAPFGFTFDARGTLQVTESRAGAISSYRLNHDGTLTSLGRVFTGQLTVCWIDTVGRYAYSSNSASDSLTGYRIQPDGTLRLLNASGISAAVGVGSRPLELRISGDGRFLYTLAGGYSSIAIYHINRATGTLTSTSEFNFGPGLAGRVGLAVE